MKISKKILFLCCSAVVGLCSLSDVGAMMRRAATRPVATRQAEMPQLVEVDPTRWVSPMFTVNVGDQLDGGIARITPLGESLYETLGLDSQDDAVIRMRDRKIGDVIRETKIGLRMLLSEMKEKYFYKELVDKFGEQNLNRDMLLSICRLISQQTRKEIPGVATRHKALMLKWIDMNWEAFLPIINRIQLQVTFTEQ